MFVLPAHPAYVALFAYLDIARLWPFLWLPSFGQTRRWCAHVSLSLPVSASHMYVAVSQPGYCYFCGGLPSAKHGVGVRMSVFLRPNRVSVYAHVRLSGSTSLYVAVSQPGYGHFCACLPSANLGQPRRRCAHVGFRPANPTCMWPFRR